jgi:hypothetical protein
MAPGFKGSRSPAPRCRRAQTRDRVVRGVGVRGARVLRAGGYGFCCEEIRGFRRSYSKPYGVL